MDKIVARAVIKYLKERYDTTENHENIVQILAEDFPSCATMKKRMQNSSESGRSQKMTLGQVV